MLRFIARKSLVEFLEFGVSVDLGAYFYAFSFLYKRDGLISPAVLTTVDRARSFASIGSSL